MALFSVIVPVYQAQNYLNACIDSVLTQSFSDFELILADDGSTDRSAEICDSYRSDPRVRVFHKSNEGATKTRLFAAQAATGQYIVPLDADDTLAPGLFDALSRAVAQYRPTVICYNYLRADGNHGKCCTDVANRHFRGEEWEKQRHRLLYDPSLSGFNSGITSFCVHSKAFERELFLKYQIMVPPQIVRGEDLAVTVPLLYDADGVYFLDYDGYYYRDNPTSVMNSFRETDISLLMLLRSYLFERLGKSMEKQINTYTAITASEFVLNAAKHFEDHGDYIRCLKRTVTPEVTALIRKAQFSGLSFKEKCRIFLTGHRFYTLLRLLVK